jgi:putative ABC transport system substrate-binding protein
VFANGSDPIAAGLVASMNRPGANITGVTYYTAALGAKRLEMLRELVPNLGVVGFLTNPTNLVSTSSGPDLEAAARALNQRIQFLRASTPSEIDAAFSHIDQQRIGALMVDVDSFYVGRHQQIVALAARHQLPASFGNRVFVKAGGLMSYADNRFESRRQAGLYAGRILKGELAAELPVLQPTKFELVINMKTAKGLGIRVPTTLLVSADEVIE